MNNSESSGLSWPLPSSGERCVSTHVPERAYGTSVCSNTHTSWKMGTVTKTEGSDWG